MLRIYNHYISRFTILLICIELFLLFVIFFIGGSAFWRSENSAITYLALLPEAIIFVFFMMLSMAVMGMYQLHSRSNLKTTVWRLTLAVVLCFTLTILVFYLVRQNDVSHGVLIMIMTLSLFCLLLLRLIMFRWFSKGALQTRALVLGVGDIAYELMGQENKSQDHIKPKFVGFVPFQGEKHVVPESLILPNSNSLNELVKKYAIEEIIIAIQERRGGGFPIQELLECKMQGIDVIDVANYFEREKKYIRMDSLYPSWLVFGGGFDQSFLRSAIKRIFDVIASLILLIATVPVMIITAVCILIEDGFPLFYRQERVGEGGKIFKVLKFRSMRKNAEQGQKPQWATTDDPRVTRVGKLIRKLRIDELPQIWNVIKNDMSFVGPRPERPYFVDMLIAQVPYYNIRHSIKPGITGWAQVSYPYGSSVEDAIEKLQYDLYYVKNHSLFFDVIILIHTVEVVLLGKGGR